MTRAQRRGSLADQLQPRLVLTVAVMAVLVALTTVLALRTILFNQLDAELDAAQVRQSRSDGRDDGPPAWRPPACGWAP